MRRRKRSYGIAGKLLSLSILRPAHVIENPLQYYPDRDWERHYRDIYAHDDSGIFMCTPNCTLSDLFSRISGAYRKILRVNNLDIHRLSETTKVSEKL